MGRVWLESHYSWCAGSAGSPITFFPENILPVQSLNALNSSFKKVEIALRRSWFGMEDRIVVAYGCLSSPAPFTNLYINLACLSVCLFVSNKLQNGWTDRAQIFCGTSHDHREGLWMIKISNICLHQNSIIIKILIILKIHEILVKIRELILLSFTM